MAYGGDSDPMAEPPVGRRPLGALVLLSPILAEMLSGSSPPMEWLYPIVPLLLIWLYGSGVLVVREAAVRWKTGWPGILLLGAAYGIVEEGLAVKSFFDPGWVDLGDLGWYGRWLDVNWVWAVWLTIYHAVVSIAIPIFLVDRIWPQARGKPFTSRRGFVAAVGFLVGATVFINLALTPYRPSPWHLLGALAAVGFLAWAARSHARRWWDRLPSGRPPSPRAYAIAGFAFLGGSFLIYAAGPALGGLPVVTVLEGTAILLGTMLLVRRTSGSGAWDRQRYAFVAGVVGFLIALAAFLELAGWRGMGVVGAAFAYLLVRWYRRAAANPTGEGATPRGSPPGSQARDLLR